MITACQPNAPLPPTIESADIEWQEGQPVSRAFGDVYFSRDNGLEETRYVFLGNNSLETRFARLKPGQAFVVAETGFGTGLNFLATWQAWQSHAPEDAILHFVSVERFPLRLSDLQQALSLWPELAPFVTELTEQYPALVRGVHRLVFASGRIRLTLYFGDALEAWEKLTFKADAWFLDGFAPALNPDLWLESVIHSVAGHSRPGTTVATFTAVGAVRRALLGAGFVMKKVPGFGRKREMLAGCFEGDTAPETSPLPDTEPANNRPVTIIGAGIAAALTARNLAERGYQVQVISRGDGPADGASGNPQAALYVKLGVDYGPETQLSLHALLHAQRTYARYNRERTCASGFWHQTGLLQLATTTQEQSRQARFLERNHYPETVLSPVTPEKASQLSGSPVTHDGLWFPDSGWLEPARVCGELLDHPLISCHFGISVSRIEPEKDHWRVHSDSAESSTLTTRCLVITGGHNVSALLPGQHSYRFKAIRGQVTQLPEADLHTPKTVICGTSYLNPASAAGATTGATFDLYDDNARVTAASHQENIDKLTRWAPGIWKDDQPDTTRLAGRVSFRCTTHDYQPVVGPVSAVDSHDGLYILTGLGSKGFAFAPLLAEWLSDTITGQPACLENTLSERLNLARCFALLR